MKFKLPKKLKLSHLVVALASGIMLILLSNTFTDKAEVITTPAVEPKEIENLQTEEKLKEILEAVADISDVKVMITYENTGVKKVTSFGEKVLTNDGAKSADSDKQTPVFTKDSSGEGPFVGEQILPEVRGVLIVANGLESRTLAMEITEAVSATLGVPVHRVKVLPAS